ncbi:MAG TPA: response regulator transcription factor [Bacteroidota bacterium]|nr:response regulator transcription factor [Bacteroidota bacterium]
MVRFLLVDDNESFLDSIERYLVSLGNSNLVCIGKATSGEEAVRMSAELKPDLVLMDFAMPGMSGLVAMKLIKQETHSSKVVILTIHESNEYRKAARVAGADDFVTKSEITSKIPRLIESLFHETVASLHISAR